MSDGALRLRAVLKAVLVCLWVGTVLGIMGLMLHIRGTAYENLFGVSLWVFSITIGIVTYRHAMQPHDRP